MVLAANIIGPGQLEVRAAMKWRQAVAAVLLVTLGLCITMAPAYASDEEARVLILNGIDPYLPAYLAIDGAMRASLAAQAAPRVVFFSEALDGQRFSLESMEPELLSLLEKKYRAVPIDREREVLSHVVKGRLNKQIAHDLGIVERTVKAHRKALITKLGVRSVAALTRLTQEAGLPIPPGDLP
jgi:DNA-binding NarL/FixJ family response regulator